LLIHASEVTSGSSEDPELRLCGSLDKERCWERSKGSTALGYPWRSQRRELQRGKKTWYHEAGFVRKVIKSEV